MKMTSMMIRKTTRILAVLIVTLFALGTIAEAAPKKVVHHRAKHVTRSASGSTARTAKRTKSTVRKSTTRRTATKKTTTKPR
jgi:hypothetical protein